MLFPTIVKNSMKNLGVTPGMLVLQEMDSNFVLKYLKEMKPNKSTGLDDVSPRFLNAKKLARVTPLHNKKKSKLEIKNYRPLSVLTFISKILERAVLVQVGSFCKEHCILYKFCRTTHVRCSNAL